ncbi:MAG TPA: hypothetical protein PK536_07725 [Ignavibacteria bacterium]|nr:hypothetical protein [Bacteroidota bacterium]HRI85322.1 hypothetical protein [Ignavibacteria bacterium]HRJ98132.1 hypothetical protein [Ignavibacteria bacterium]
MLAINIINDTVNIIAVEDSAVVILPDNYTLRLRGNTTSLIMKPGSKMMFGENSGIVCDSGGKVIDEDNEIGVYVESKNRFNL